MSRRGVVAWAALGLVALLAGACIWLLVANGERLPDPNALIALGGMALAAIGMLIFGRTGNAIGWLLWVSGFALAVVSFVDQYGVKTLVTSPGSFPAPRALLAIPGFIGPFIVAIPLIFLLFPTGRPPSDRWRPVGWSLVAGAVMASLGFGTRPEPLNGAWNDHGIRMANPFGLPELWGVMKVVWMAGVAIALVASALAIASLFVRYRRSSGEERAQLRWLLLVALVALGLFAVVQFLVAISGIRGDWVSDATFDLLFGALAVDLAFGIPVACAIAILKYRLYDIDLVISKTIVFGALALLIGAVYVAIVAGVGELVGSNTQSVTLRVAATALIAVSFEPARTRLQRWANRLVYGRRATPYEVMADFGHRIAAVPSADAVLTDMADAAANGVGAAAVRLRLFLNQGSRTVTNPSDAPFGEPTLAIPVVHGGEPIGELAIVKPANEPLRTAERGLLEDLAGHAGLALHNVRLTSELQSKAEELAEQTEELGRSGGRLVAARDAQRRRLERELRDGVVRELDAICDELAVDAERLDSHAEEVLASLDTLGRRANAALEELRDVARGIFPPLLADEGLAAALGSHVRKLGPGAEARIDPDLARRRFDPLIENAVYFCCIQALRNAERHAAGARAVVRLERDEGHLRFIVQDDGPGFEPDDTPQGEGMQIMHDRMAALGGTLEVHSAAGSGTTVVGTVPIGEHP